MWDDEEIEKEEVIDESYVDLDELLEDDSFLPKKRTRRKKSEIVTTDEYVNKNEMWNELYNYYKSLGDNYDWANQKLLNKNVFPPISDKLTSIVFDIATKMGHRANFCGYSWLDEMKGDAMHKMIKSIRDCLFACYSTVPYFDKDDDKNTICYYDKKDRLQTRSIEEDDVFFVKDGKNYVTFKANPFGYFSRITTNSYLNRIKKENELDEAKRAFQEDTWERLYSNENFRNVRRQRFIESDENDAIFDE